MQETLEIIDVNCPFCDSSEKTDLQLGLVDVEDRIDGEYNISKCSRCGLNYLSRTPSPSSLGLCYRENYHVRAVKRRSRFTTSLYSLRDSMRARKIASRFDQPPSKFVEIGCADGAVLFALEKIWGKQTELYGADIAIGHIVQPEDSLVTFTDQDLTNVFKPNSIDGAALFEVVEHLPNPKKYLSDLNVLLKTGGQIMGTLPDVDGIWRKVFPKHWSGLQIPRHQLFFTRSTLTQLMNDCGFQIVFNKPAFDAGELAVSIVNWITDKLNLKTRPRQSWMFLPLVILTAPLMYIQLKIFNSSGTQEFLAKKYQSI